jgi:hypothetical protein
MSRLRDDLSTSFSNATTILGFRRKIFLIFIMPSVLYSVYILCNAPGTHFVVPLLHNDRILVVKATFTSSAYQRGSWYDKGVDSVKTVPVITDESQYTRRMKNGGAWFAFNALSRFVDYSDDIEVSKNPSILERYDKVIMLHNEYVTEQEYNAVMAHPNVFYAFPNAMYRLVKYDGTQNTITLVGETGNQYSRATWESADEYDRCYVGGYSVIDYPNGRGLSCYPAYQSIWNPFLIITILSSN